MVVENRLLQALRAGERGAFERLVREHQTLVHHMIGRLVKQREDVIELCQETFLKVHANLPGFRGDSSLATWIGRIAFTTAARHLRRKQIKFLEVDEEGELSLDELAIDPHDLTQALVDADLHAHLHKAMETLPPLQRLLLTLYYQDEWDIEAISAMTELPAGTVKSHLFRGRSRLRTILAPRLGEHHD